MSDETPTLYQRLGGYDAIAAVANDLLPRLRADPQRPSNATWSHSSRASRETSSNRRRAEGARLAVRAPLVIRAAEIEPARVRQRQR